MADWIKEYNVAVKNSQCGPGLTEQYGVWTLKGSLASVHTVQPHLEQEFHVRQAFQKI